MINVQFAQKVGFQMNFQKIVIQFVVMESLEVKNNVRILKQFPIILVINAKIHVQNFVKFVNLEFVYNVQMDLHCLQIENIACLYVMMVSFNNLKLVMIIITFHLMDVTNVNQIVIQGVNFALIRNVSFVKLDWNLLIINVIPIVEMDQLLSIQLNNVMMQIQLKMMDVLIANLNVFLIVFHVQIMIFVYQYVVMVLLSMDLRIVMMEIIHHMTDAINVNLNVHKDVLIVKMDKVVKCAIINIFQIMKMAQYYEIIPLDDQNKENKYNRVCSQNFILIDYQCINQCGNGILNLQYEECDD
ncbi:unnamed protein product [Paramecium pentaurelia]|uniref:Transmembrane protein n=1 Tax=Paramecium pentaurelia TaxID=43138 RepID=A0A8S1XYJ7_9CILI|nr:unnamed protein product [Paramecium pentaurelia]